MPGAVQAADRRTLAIIGAGLLATLCCGVVAVRSPLIAVAGVLAVLVFVGMVRNLAAGIAVFVVSSFGAVISLGGAATIAKGVGFLLVLAWGAAIARQSGRESRSLLHDQPLLVSLAVGLAAWSVLSAAWASSPSTAISGASRYAQDLVLLPILYTGLTRFKHARWAAAAFVAAAVGAVFYGVLSGTTADGSRVVGALLDPDETAAVMVAAAVLAGGLACSDQLSTRARALAVAGAIVSLLGLALTASRGGLVALAFAVAVAVVIADRWRPRVAKAALIGVVVLVGWFAFFAPASSVDHLSNLQSGRTTLWQVAGRTISANPITGVGNDNFALDASSYLLRPGATTAADQILVVQHPAQNIYLELWADLGIVGLALFLGFVALCLRCAWKAAQILRKAGRWADEIFARALIVAIAGMLMADFFQTDQYDKQLFLLLALAPALLAVARREAGRSSG